MTEPFVDQVSGNACSCSDRREGNDAERSTPSRRGKVVHLHGSNNTTNRFTPSLNAQFSMNQSGPKCESAQSVQRLKLKLNILPFIHDLTGRYAPRSR